MSMTYQIWRFSAARQCSQSLLNSRQILRSSNGRICAAQRAYAPQTQRQTYATYKPKKNQKDSESKNGQQVQPGKPPKGLESLYSGSGPFSSSFSSSSDPHVKNEQDDSNKLTVEEIKMLDDLVEKGYKDLPDALAKDLERQVKMIKQYGIRKNIEDMREIVNEMTDGENLTLSKAARLIRLSARMIRHAEEELSSKESAKEGQGKKSGEDDKSSAGGGYKFAEIKLDTGSVITAVFTAYLVYRSIVPSENTREITWQEFQASLLDKGLVEKLQVINHNRVKVFAQRDAVRQMHPESPAANTNFYYMFTIGSVEAFERKLEDAQVQLGIPTSERIPVSYTEEISWSSTIFSILPALAFIVGMTWLSRRMGGGGGGGGSSGIFGMGRSRAKKYNHETDIKIRFRDVAGMDEAKQEIMEFVSFLKEPGQFQRLGAKIPRGAILSGPPGTGKTLLAKATAGESQVPFFSVSGSEFVEMFVGVGASRVRDLFANARKSTPCIIFIDEIDAIGKSRGKQYFGGGNDEREATLNQILTEMDGFNTSEQVVVLAGTNRPDVLDSALMRPGRFDRHITIDRPTMQGRQQIFGVHLRKILTDEDMDHLQGRLAALTPGFSGADIANACNEAALIAARGKADKVRMIHFEQAIERVVGGLEKKSLVLSKEDKRTVAYHEAGHAICGWYFKYADPLLKVSIIPRGQGALGYAQYLPPGDQYLINVNQLLDRMAMTLGGRVSEELHFDTVTSGASDDFKKVTRMATAMVTKWGMSHKIGYIYFEDDQQQQLHKPFSEETARNIDTEVRRIVDEAYKQCKDLLTEKKTQVGIVAEELLKKEVLTRDDMVRLLGKRPFEDNKEFEQYFGGGKSAPPPPPSETANEPPPGDTPPPPAPAIIQGDQPRAP